MGLQCLPLWFPEHSLFIKNLFPSQSQEIIWGNFINTISGHIQLLDAINIESKPSLWFVSNSIVDTLDGDGDKRTDAGETIELWFDIRNSWGQIDSVWCGIEFGEFEDTTTATILKDNALIGSISPYAHRTNETNPLKIKIDPSVEHNRDIVFQASLWHEGAVDTVTQEMIFNVENGVELVGMIDSVLVLTPDKNWIVSGSFRITENGELIILPGTKITINRTIDLKGKIKAIGEKNNLIEFTSDNFSIGIKRTTKQAEIDSFYYCKFTNMSSPLTNDRLYTEHYFISYCIFESIKGNVITRNFFDGVYEMNNSEFRNIIADDDRLTLTDALVYMNNFSNVVASGFYFDNTSLFEYNNVIGCRRADYTTLFWLSRNYPNYKYNNLILNERAKFGVSGNSNIIELEPNYLGTTKNELLDELIIDFFDNSSLPMLDYQLIMYQPSDSSHGIVWKVLVDGIDPQDEVLDPIGPGEHRFDVYFNRPMDIDYTPSLSFGVREPYNQQAVTDSSFWSADSMIWTAYKTIQLHTGDGINRIRVADARDTEDFEIPIEDQRFEFVIDAAGLSSTEFNAIAGLGKIELDWKIPEDVSDLLGYNLYRFTNLTDTTYTDAKIINTEMILDTSYVDYDVVPGNNYYYQYTVVKTDFSESDFSKVVGSTALTASAGDANGDLTVTVLDLVSIVSYLLNENPQPFIFEAADVDSNGVINVLDIVSTVNIVMGQSIPKTNGGKSSNAELIVENGNLILNGAERLSALQLRIVGSNIENSELITGELLNGMEFVHRYNKDTLDIVVFNYKNKALNSREGKLFGLQQGQILSIQNIVASDADGNLINLTSNSSEVLLPKEYVLYQNYPNPFNPETRIKYGLPEPQNVTITIFNILGQKIKTYNLAEQPAGYHEVMWKSTNDFSRKVATGVYIYRIKAGDFVDVKKMLLLK